MGEGCGGEGQRRSERAQDFPPARPHPDVPTNTPLWALGLASSLSISPVPNYRMSTCNFICDTRAGSI